MTDVERIRRVVENLYQAVDEPAMDIPPELQAYEWACFAKEYVLAASVLEREGPQYLLPTLQVTGQAVESALKACIATVNPEPSNTHNLIQLYELAATRGFQLADRDLAAIVDLHHFYFQDLASKTKYKALQENPWVKNGMFRWLAV